MRRANPIENTGIIRRKSDKAFLGSCFIFRYPEVLLTAAHCVGEYDLTEIEITLTGIMVRNPFQITRVDLAQNADLAIVRISGINEINITWLVYQICDDRLYGEDFAIFGYPQEYFEGRPAPTPRLFKGYFQRFFRHKSHLGYFYSAVELNISCPGGLSGSAVFNQNFHCRLYGVVTEDVKTTTELESVIEIDDDGKQFKESSHNMVNYGVAVWLSDVSGWIDAHVHPVSPEEIARRSNNQHAWGDM